MEVKNNNSVISANLATQKYSIYLSHEPKLKKEAHALLEVLKTRIGRWRNSEFNIKKKILCTFNPRKTWVYTHFYKPPVKVC